jgi:UPF0755 protein
MPEEPISESRPAPQPINGQPSGLISDKKIPIRKILPWVIGVLVIIVGVVASGVTWYNIQLTPVGDDAGQLKKITINSGSTPSQIGKVLEQQSIIRSSFAFEIYVRFSGKNNLLQAGTYRLSPAESTPRIVGYLSTGSSMDKFNITFYPGATLADDIKVFKKAGYSDQEITAALNETYNSPLFASKPSNADLEGYIYGETYNFNTGATVQDILKRTFAEFYKIIQDNNLVKGFADQGLNLYQGITLASIIQREVNSPTGIEPSQDQRQVAQVFYSRLNSGMALGSDVTYQYIADKTGAARDPNLDSPYNTRRYTGLPPGPISAPGLTALKAAANPASEDYLYFLSGDDDIVYFAHTNSEHEANIVNHCKTKCSIP